MIHPFRKRQPNPDSVTIPKAEYENLKAKAEVDAKEIKRLTTQCEALGAGLADAQRMIERLQNRK